MPTAEPPVPGSPGLTADALLASPRGRSLCVSLLDEWPAAPDPAAEATWRDALDAARTGDAVRCARKISDYVQAADVAGTPLAAGDLWTALVDTVEFAAYHVGPGDEDQGFAAEPARAALRPAAEAVVAATQTADLRWWTAPVDRGHQGYTQFLGDPSLPEPPLAGAAKAAAAWRTAAREHERSARKRRRRHAGPADGPWWSSPATPRLPITTRALPALGTARLALVESGLGWRSARCWPLGPADDARVYEIHGPGQWAALVHRYPFDVSESRRGAWRRATGWAGRWLIPDYAAVAADWDAVHVSVAGYLTTAGVALPAGDGARTLLAGWDPDATWWLSDVLSLTGSPSDWVADDQAASGWRPAASAG